MAKGPSGHFRRAQLPALQDDDGHALCRGITLQVWNHPRRSWLVSAGAATGSGRMQFDNSKSGDHLERGPDNREAVVSNIPERQGVTGQGVRYVLLVGTAAIVILFAIFLALALN